jgi:hypothetical protein
MEKKGENSSTGATGEEEDRNINSNPGTPARTQSATSADNGEQPDETRMDVETTMTPTTLARANRMLDEDDTPAKEANKSPVSRNYCSDKQT